MKYRDKSGHVWKDKKSYYRYMAADMSKSKKVRSTYAKKGKR